MEQVSKDLVQVRSEIDALDEGIVELIARRLELAREAARVKAAMGVEGSDPAREAAVVRRAATVADRKGVDAEGVRQLFWNLIGLSRRSQEALSHGPGPAPVGVPSAPGEA